MTSQRVTTMAFIVVVASSVDFSQVETQAGRRAGGASRLLDRNVAVRFQENVMPFFSRTLSFESARR